MTRDKVHKFKRCPWVDYNCDKCGSLVLGFDPRSSDNYAFLCCGGRCGRAEMVGLAPDQIHDVRTDVKWLPLSLYEVT